MGKMMKRLIVVLGAFLLFFGVLGNANALNFTLGRYLRFLNNSDPGLVIHKSNVLTPGSSFDLALGGSAKVPLFKIWTDAVDVATGEDTVRKDIAVMLNFTTPVGISGGPITGNTFGQRVLFGAFQEGKVEWNDPTYFSFGGTGGTSKGEKNGATVDLKLKDAVAGTSVSVPESGTMLVLGSVLLCLVVVSRKRFNSSPKPNR
jgi:hypothetical protein